MGRDFDDDDDLEELDDDDDDLEELDDDDDDDLEELDDDDDDLEELEDDASVGMEEESRPSVMDMDEGDLADLDDDDVVSSASAEESGPSRPGMDEDDHDFDDFGSSSPAPVQEEEEDEDASFFDEVVEEEDDLGLGDSFKSGPVPVPVETDVPSEPTEKTTTRQIPQAAEAKAFQPKFILLPVLGILLGAGFFFLKSQESDISPSKPQKPKIIEKKTVIIQEKPQFKKPELDVSIPEDYKFLKKIEMVDLSKIDSLVTRGLIKKRADGSSLVVKKLTLVLYEAPVRYVVSQTYYYEDGTKWTVETHFSGLESGSEEVIKAFDAVYAG